MTSSELRQSFLDFFHSKQHTIVPSSSLMPASPNLLFTNAGMNQFVPIFLGERKPDVSRWQHARPALDTRASDTQKCIRAGGKHNDLEDVGFDTYHHTLFEMLGNWSFGDYFKRESINWGWELLTKVWGLPKERLYATVYKPGAGDPSEFDQEAYDVWAAIFRAEGLDPALHIRTGGKKDNFWMMGDTGPCGPCSEIHFDLTPKGDSRGELVNSGSSRCIEIWNHVFIQFNAEPDGTFRPLSARHVDTGMGFERVAGIMATTKGFTDFSPEPSNYSADVFAPLFARIASLSGRTYAATVPTQREGLPAQEMTDVAFRVLADHARTISCAIADGILPGNEGRNYVIRRILRRGILYGKKLGLGIGFFEQLVEPVQESLGAVFPELREKGDLVRKVIRSEEESFGRTLDRGLAVFERALARGIAGDTLPGALAFELYDTYGFPLDMTQLLATERGLKVDVAGFETEMEKQRERARAAQVKSVISVKDDESGVAATRFDGFDDRALADVPASLIDIVADGRRTFLVFDHTPFYAEMGGQVGDTGVATFGDRVLFITDTIRDAHGRHLHEVRTEDGVSALKGHSAKLTVAIERRHAIQRHHSATHILDFALRAVLGTHVLQQGSSVTPDRLRFDYSHFEALSPAQIAEIEHICNLHILENDAVRWYEVPFAEKPAECIATFGEKYGAVVRVVDIGGWSLELCGGTHVRATGEIGAFKIVTETSVAAGKRRIEAVCGEAAQQLLDVQHAKVLRIAQALGCNQDDIEARLKVLADEKAALERELKNIKAREALAFADELVAKTAPGADGLRRIAAKVDAADANSLRELASKTGQKAGASVVVLAAEIDGKASFVAVCSPEAVKAGVQAGALIRDLAGKLGGKGGGKPDMAMGGAPTAQGLAEAISSLKP